MEEENASFRMAAGPWVGDEKKWWWWGGGAVYIERLYRSGLPRARDFPQCFIFKTGTEKRGNFEFAQKLVRSRPTVTDGECVSPSTDERICPSQSSLPPSRSPSLAAA